MAKSEALTGQNLLLMGSKAFREPKLPDQLKQLLDQAMTEHMHIVVGEAPGANHRFQDYLHSKGYTNVVVGHAKSIRYNAGQWETKQYGLSVPEREQNMIDECDCAIIIWANKSGVIAENLECLKRANKPTFVYEYSTATCFGTAGWLDPKRVYDSYFYYKEHLRKKKHQKPE